MFHHMKGIFLWGCLLRFDVGHLRWCFCFTMLGLMQWTLQLQTHVCLYSWLNARQSYLTSKPNPSCPFFSVCACRSSRQESIRSNSFLVTNTTVKTEWQSNKCWIYMKRKHKETRVSCWPRCKVLHHERNTRVVLLDQLAALFRTTLFPNTSLQLLSPTLSNFHNTLLQHSFAHFSPTHLHTTSLQLLFRTLSTTLFFKTLLSILPNTSARDISTRLTFNICATVFSSTSLQRSIPTFLHTQNSLLEHVSTLTTLFSSSPTLLSSFFLRHFSPTLLYNFLQHSSYTSLPHFSATLFSNTSLQHSSTLLFSNTSITSQHSSPTLLCNTSLQYSSPTLPWTYNTLLQPFSATLLYTTLLQHLPKLTTLFSKSSLQHFSTLLFSNTLLQHSSSDFFPWNNRLTSMCHVCYMQFFAWLSKQAP